MQLSVCAGCGVIAFLMSDLNYWSNPDKYPDTYLSSPLLPVGLSVIVGFIVAECFFAVSPEACFDIHAAWSLSECATILWLRSVHLLNST